MKIFKGKVIKKSSPKTIAVKVERIVSHPVYKKRFRQTKTYHVHDENDVVKLGETVEFVASRPFSKTKKWMVVLNKESLLKVSNSDIAKPKQSGRSKKIVAKRGQATKTQSVAKKSKAVKKGKKK